MPPQEIKSFSFIFLDEAMEFLNIPAQKQDENRNLVTRLINTACQRVEGYIDGPVIAREYIEYIDGTSSDTIIPSYRPIRDIVELKVDYNRAFGVATAFTQDDFSLAGIPDQDQQTKEKIEKGNFEPLYSIKGSHIVLRDDNNTAVLGRLFTGSVTQSIKLTYKAGIALDIYDVPEDLKYAALLIIEHLWMAKHNRDIKVTSKSNAAGSGASYNKQLGWPQEVIDILEDYKNYGFPTIGRPQKNTFTL